MISRIANKLHNRMGILGDESLATRVFAWCRRPLGRLFLRREGFLANLGRLGRGTAAELHSEGPTSTEATPGTGRRILVVSLRAWIAHSVYESLLAQALRLRGAEVSLLTCGGGQPLCEQGWARHAWPRPCDRCAWYTERVARAARLRHYRLADGLPWGGDARDAPVEPPVSPSAPDPYRASEISLPWMLKSTDIDGSPHGRAMERDFAVAAAGVAASVERVLDEFRPETVVLLNGLFAAERVIYEAALARDIRVVTYEIAPRANSLVFSAGAPAPMYEMDAAWESSRDRPLTDEQRSGIVAMLTARSEGQAAHERYFEDPLTGPDQIRVELDLPPGARVISMFTNIAWDSAVIGCDLAYESMLHWITDAVHAVGELEDAALVVRVHPAEQRWGTMQPVVEALGELPTNVRVIGPERPLSSYGLLAISDLVLTYTTTVGLEAASRGIPVAVAGDVHYRGRGFTHDLQSPDGLRSLLDAGPWSMSDDQVELALRYAFLFFFRFMIPFPTVPLEQGMPRAVPDDPSALRPGADPYLDFVCDRILDGGDFILPEELAQPAWTGN